MSTRKGPRLSSSQSWTALISVAFTFVLVATQSAWGSSPSSAGFASERAYRYLEASRTLAADGPIAASTLLQADTRAPDVLWLAILAAGECVGINHIGDGTTAAESYVLAVTILCWLGALLGAASLASRAWGEIWGLVCGAFLLSSGAFLWGCASGDDLGLIALLFVALIWSLRGETPRERFYAAWLVLLAPLAGPIGVGLAVGCVLALWALGASRHERAASTGAVVIGGLVYATLVSAVNPAGQAGVLQTVGERSASVFGNLMRGAWSLRADTFWGMIGRLGGTESLLGWAPGLMAALGLAVWITPAASGRKSADRCTRNVGIGLGFMVPGMVFAASATASPIREVYPLFVPGLAMALTGAAYGFWTYTQRLGVTPVSVFVALPIVVQLQSYAPWIQDAREGALRQGRIVAAFEQEMAVEPSEYIISGDVPIVRWRLGPTGRILSPVASGGPAPVLMPRIAPWKDRRSPLAPLVASLDGWDRVRIGTEPPLTRWSPRSGSPSPPHKPIRRLEPLWTTSMGFERLTVHGFAAHLEPWWHVPGMESSRHMPWETHLLTTETDGTGRGYGSILSSEFELTRDLMLVRVGSSQPDPDCSLRLLVWQSANDPFAQEVPIERPLRHIDLLEPGVRLQSELFVYDDPAALILDGDDVQAWRVVKIARGTDMETGINEFLWTVRPWLGRRARWSLSDRSSQSSLFVDSIHFGDNPAVRSWDFESGGYDGWTVIGEAFGVRPVDRPYLGQQAVDTAAAGYFANSYLDGSDAPRGVLESWSFPVEGDVLSFRLGGGKDSARLGVGLLIDGTTVARATGKDSESLDLVAWDVSAYRDRQAVVRVFDLSSAPWGHVLVDDIQLWPRADVPADIESALRGYDYPSPSSTS